MSYSKLILRDSAEIVWPLDDITESSSVSRPINFFTENPNSYSASINPAHTNLLHNPIVFGGGTLLSFTSSAIGLSIPALDRFSELFDNKDSTLSIWFQSNNLFTEEYPIFKKRGHPNIGLFIKNNYLIFRYGTSASYVETAADVVDMKEPNHIVVSKSNSGLSLMINGIPFTSINSPVKLDKDSQHIFNNYIDFYGPPQNSWNIDSISIYPNSINSATAKRHYVYGLGKTTSDDIFYTRGGNLYNMSTLATEKIIDINWGYKDEWRIRDLIDLSLEEDGIKPAVFATPRLYSFDNNINKTSDKLSFHVSGSTTQASFIEIDKLYNKIGGGEYPFFVKVILDGPLPNQYLSQRIMSYGKSPDNEILKFDLYNDAGIYKVRIGVSNSSSTSFIITNPTASPTFYVGMKFTGNTVLYFAEAGGNIQSASFASLDSSGYGIDPLTSFFPPPSDMILRIGSSLNYDKESFTDYVYEVEQFGGTVERFLVAQEDFTSSAGYSYLDSYTKSKYEFIYDTNKNRFRVKTYGQGNFIIHSANFAQYIDDNTQKIGANVVKFGYPDINSSSQVHLYVTHSDYTGSTIYPKTKINQINYLDFLNNKNIADTYLTFDFEIFAEDSIYYPPKIKYFQMQTFKNNNDTVIMRDDAGPDYTLYQTASVIYLPEVRYTPTIFVTDESGIKLSNTIADFTEKIMGKPLDPTIINGLKLWLDARFINGIGRTGPNDDSRIIQWNDLSENNNHAIQNISASAPIFRSQSLNLLRSNQLNGSDTDNISFITGNNLTVESSTDAAITGVRGIKATPNNSSIDSYVDVSFNTASISTFSNQSYTIVGSIKLDKPQTASALHINARKILIYNTDGSVETLAASSYAATNSKGIYSLSATFSTDVTTIRSIFRFYNGSYDSRDYVYWDNLGVYPIISGSAQYSWVFPLTENDHPIVKFNGNNLSLISSASITHPSSLYVVARNFNDSIFIQSTSASILYSNSASYFVSYGSAQNYAVSDNSFHIFSIINNGTTTELFIDGVSVGSKNTGASNIDQLIVGKGLKGDIAAILLYDEINSSEDRNRIENWLAESFSIFTI